MGHGPARRVRSLNTFPCCAAATQALCSAVSVGIVLKKLTLHSCLSFVATGTWGPFLARSNGPRRRAAAERRRGTQRHASLSRTAWTTKRTGADTPSFLCCLVHDPALRLPAWLLACERPVHAREGKGGWLAQTRTCASCTAAQTRTYASSGPLTDWEAVRCSGRQCGKPESEAVRSEALLCWCRAGAALGFCQYRLVVEEGAQVLYVYELQVSGEIEIPCSPAW